MRNDRLQGLGLPSAMMKCSTTGQWQWLYNTGNVLNVTNSVFGYVCHTTFFLKKQTLKKLRKLTADKTSITRNVTGTGHQTETWIYTKYWTNPEKVKMKHIYTHPKHSLKNL